MSPHSGICDIEVETGIKSPAGEIQKLAVDGKGEWGAHVLDINQLESAEKETLKTTKDGQCVLIPQPSDDPHDPLNWSPLKKHTTLIVVAVVAAMPDFGSSIGVVTLLPQAK